MSVPAVLAGQNESSYEAIPRSEAGVATHATESESIQVVGFRLGSESYGIEITKIREIILIGEITRVPQVEESVEGIINIRGSVVPVIDLRKHLSLPAEPYTEHSRIIMCNVDDGIVGVIVDSVSEVIHVSKSQISPTPPAVASLGKEYISGLAVLEDRMLILLHADKLLARHDAATNDSVDD